MASRNDFDSLPDRAGRARTAVNSLSRAFDDLSKSGRLSHQSVMGIASTLPLLATPAGAAAVGIGAVTMAIAKLVESGAQIREARLEVQLKEIERQLDVTTAGWEAYFSAILRGSSEVEATLQKREAEQRASFEALKDRNDERIKSIDASIAKRHEEIDANERHNKSLEKELDGLQRYNNGTPTHVREIERVTRALKQNTDQINEARAAIDQLRQDREAILASVGGAAKETANALKPAQGTAQAIGAIMGAVKATAPEVGNSINEFTIEMMQGTEVTAEMRAALSSLPPEFDEIEKKADSAEVALLELGLAMQDVVVGGFGIAGANAFDVYADAMERSISINELHSETTGRAMQNALSQTVRAIGQEAAVRGGMETAAALVSLAIGDARGAAMHGAAASIYFGIAAAAGVGASALSVNPGGAGGGAGGGRRFDSGGDRGPTYQIFLLGAPDAHVQDELARWVQQSQQRRDT